MIQRTRTRLLTGGAALAVLLATGCTIHRPDQRRSWQRFDAWITPSYVSQPARPTLDMDDAQIEATLASSRERAALRAAELARLEATPRESLAATAEGVAVAYERGAPAAADALLASRPNLVSFERAGGLVDVSARFVEAGAGGALELTIARRPGVEGAVAVAFPPGTLAEPDRGAPPPDWALAAGWLGAVDERGWTHPDQEREYGHWPPAQDLALLRAPVLFLRDGQESITSLVPVACASFHLGAPQAGQPYRLRRIDAGSRLEQLLVQLCAQPVVDDAEAQLAVWLSRDDISWEAFVAQGGAWGRLVTFEHHTSVLPRHARGAARLMLEAGVDPRPLRFFGGAGLDTQPIAEPEPRQQPQEEQQPVVPEGTPDLRA